MISHPVAACLVAADLLRAVWDESPIVVTKFEMDPDGEGCVWEAKERVDELQDRYEYRNAINNYVQHLGECTLCRTVLEDMNERA